MQERPEVSIYAVLFVSSFVLVLLLTPLSVRLAHILGAVDLPTGRKVHTTPIPRLGGVAVAAAIAISLAFGYAVNPYIRADIASLAGMAAGAAIIVFIGILDDIWNIRPLPKLAAQVAAATVAALLGAQFHLASNPMADSFRDYFDLGMFSIPLSVLWIVALTNAMNLIDGLDGLATGVAMFAAVALFLISVDQRAGMVTYMYVLVAGATLGFLKFAHHPASVFLGDCGSTFLGFVLACLSIQGTQKSYTLAAFFIPIIVFGVPIFDSIIALLRRYLRSASLLEADRFHIHHQLLNSGLSQRQSVWILYGVTIVLGIIGFSFTVLHDEYAAVITLIIGTLGGFMAKEFNVFGTERRELERKYRADHPREP